MYKPEINPMHEDLRGLSLGTCIPLAFPERYLREYLLLSMSTFTSFGLGSFDEQRLRRVTVTVVILEKDGFSSNDIFRSSTQSC